MFGGAGDGLETFKNGERLRGGEWVSAGTVLPGGLSGVDQAVVVEVPVRLMGNYADMGQSNVRFNRSS